MQKSTIIAAMNQPGFDNWRPVLDVPHLVRPRQRPKDLPGNGREAAVLLLVFPDKRGDLMTALTRRHRKLTKHAGQISLPGGRRDPGETLDQTALREAEEEIGIAAVEIELLGKLNPVYIPPSDFTVAPYVGWYDGEPQFIRNDQEVDEIIQVPIAALLDPGIYLTGPVETGSGKTMEVPYFQVDLHQVWGATGIMLSEFVDRLRAVL